MQIVGVDLGTYSGITKLFCRNKRIVHLNIKGFSPESLNIVRDEFCYYKYMKCIEKYLEKPIELVVFEDYIYNKRFFNIFVAEMVGQLKRFLIDQKINFLCVHPNFLKKLILGKGKAKDREIIAAGENFLSKKNYESDPEKRNIHMSDSVIFAEVGYNFSNNMFPPEEMKKLTECLVVPGRE